MRDRWISGGVAAALAPMEWQDIVAAAEPDERERLLLAIAGQAFDVAFRPAAPKTLTTRAALPLLGAPVVPERLRPLFRAALKTAVDPRAKLRVVVLVGARGHVAHPFDWMPTATDVDAPPVYAPWVAWQAEASVSDPASNALNADTWDEYFPAARRAALAELRQRDPAAARTLLEAKVGAESPDVRLTLLEVLQVKLSADDTTYLQNVLADRSARVKQLAARLLSRIGQSPEGGDADAKELADFIDVRRTGIIRGRSVYAFKTLQNDAQAARRTQLLRSVQLIDLAKALGIAERDLVGAWELGGRDGVDRAFARAVGDSGSDAAAQTLGARLIEAGDVVSLDVLLPRLDRAAGRRFIQLVLSSESGFLEHLHNIADTEVSAFDSSELMASSFYRRQRSLLAERADDSRLEASLGLFGFLATPAAAEAMIADLTAAGLAPAEPSLALLRLNAALAMSDPWSPAQP
jgi:hypothetical protein